MKGFKIRTSGNGDKIKDSKRSLLSQTVSWFLIVIISGGILLTLMGVVLSSLAQKKASILLGEINGTCSSLQINLFTRSVTVKSLVWESPGKAYPNKVAIRCLRLSGISLYQLILNQKLNARELLLDSGELIINKAIEQDSVQTRKKKSLPFEVDNVVLRNIFIQLKRDTLTEIEGLFNLRYGSLKFDSTSQIMATLKSEFKHFIGSITKLRINEKKGFYTIVVHKIDFDSQAQSLIIDSIKLIPNYGKYEFAHHWGEQTDRIDLSIGKIELKGLHYRNLFDSLISIAKISLHTANLHTFRDKRIPDGKLTIMAMPMITLGNLPVALEIDSIAITNSSIRVEELAEEATSTGQVNFQNLTALMTGLSNRYYSNKPQYAQLDARANFMGSGLIAASFRFPLDGSPLYSAKGKVSNFPLQDLNPMLENSAHLRIESGVLNELYFNFNYTDFMSSGTIEINYDNLILSSLNSDKKKGTKVLKTFLMNAFVKTTKNKSTAQSKRMGTIDAARDRHRFIFNIWWKSLQSGLKSSLGSKNTSGVQSKK